MDKDQQSVHDHRAELTENNPAEEEILYRFSLNVIATKTQLSGLGVGKRNVHVASRTNEDNGYTCEKSNPSTNYENLNPDLLVYKQQPKENADKKALCVPNKIYRATFEKWQVQDYKDSVANFWIYLLTMGLMFIAVYYYKQTSMIFTFFFSFLKFYNIAYSLMVIYVLWNNIYNHCKIPDENDDKKQNVKECKTKGGNVSIIVCAYLPNEKDILLDTMTYILHKLDNAHRRISFCVCYNTPEPITPIETKILEFHTRTVNQRQVYVVKNEHSKSKAENINCALDCLSMNNALHEYVYILDADHRPDPDCLRLLLQKIESAPDIDCVHGATYIRNTEYSTLAKYIHAEFWCFYNVILYILKGFSGTVFFGGSNGIWKTNSIGYFDPDAQTEDIEMSIRALFNNATIDFEPQARSGELAPFNMEAFITQRTRWAMGWNEVTFRYFSELWTCPVTSLNRRLGLFFLLPFRFVLPWGFVIAMLEINFKNYSFSLCTFACMQAGLLVWIVLKLPQSLKYRTSYEQLEDLISISLFLLCLPVNLIQQQIFEVLANFSLYYRRNSDWIVTRRSTTEDIDMGRSSAE